MLFCIHSPIFFHDTYKYTLSRGGKAMETFAHLLNTVSLISCLVSFCMVFPVVPFMNIEHWTDVHIYFISMVLIYARVVKIYKTI